MSLTEAFLKRSRALWVKRERDYEAKAKHAHEMHTRREQQLAARATASEPVHATRNSPNQSSRNGIKPRVIVLHSTEGSYESSINWLCNPASQASAHVINSKAGKSTRLVPDAQKAWHVAAANPFTLGLEQEGYASQQVWPEAQLDSAAAWVAYWARKFDIPIVKSTTNGVCRHSDLGAAGGGHQDPGSAYPFDKVLAKARAL
jgi:N-acetyl-anhydromuramyl-L-alanine amidase AmpD